MAKIPDELYRLSVKDLAQLCGVSEKTVKRWWAGTSCPPKAVLMIASGDLGVFDPAWRGWVLRDGHLWSPENWGISMSDVLASRLHEAQLACWRLEVRKLKAELANAELARLEEQPTPEELGEIQIRIG